MGSRLLLQPAVLLFVSWSFASGVGQLSAQEATPAKSVSIPEVTPSKSKKPAHIEGGIVTRPGYRLASGDVIDIVVWKEPDASVGGMMIRADGKISIPFLKEVKAAGFTPTELEDLLTKDLAKYVKDPEVTVLVKQVTSEKLYILGAVRKPGTFVLQGPMTVLQALSEAGGPTDFAKKKKIYILRNNQKIAFNYAEVIKGLNMDQNIQVFPGDTIVVPQ
jgi:polysaccharide export outer membrane protein